MGTRIYVHGLEVVVFCFRQTLVPQGSLVVRYADSLGTKKWSLVTCLSAGSLGMLKKMLQISKPFHLQQARIFRRGRDGVVFQNPGLVVGNEYGIDACGQGRIDV